MGKGDKKTRRGKITQGSYGKTRPRNTAAKREVANVKEVSEAQEIVKEKAKTTKAKAEKPTSTEEKPKTARKKKTEE